MNDPRTVLPTSERDSAGGDLLHAIRDAARADQLNVIADFDGTLADIEEDPGAARPLPGIARLLESLARCPMTTVMVLSGRARADLIERMKPDVPAGVRFFGCFGAETDGPGPQAPLSGEDRETLVRMCEHLHAVAQEFNAGPVESKRVGCTIHVRRVPPEQREAALVAARRIVATEPGIVEIPGNLASTFVLGHLYRGKLRTVRGLHRAACRLGSAATIYVGDDEPAEFDFASASASGVIAIRVGRTYPSSTCSQSVGEHAGSSLRPAYAAPTRASRAPLLIASPRAVAGMLSQTAVLRTAAALKLLHADMARRALPEPADYTGGRG